MKQKTIITLAIAGLVLLIFSFARSCYYSDKLKAKEKEYTEFRAITEEELKQSSVRLDALTKAIELRDEAIVKLDAEVVAKKRELAAAKSAYQDLVDSEPVQPELETQPLVINLRAQIGQLKGMVTLVQDIAQKQANEIDELKVKVALLEDVGKEWKSNYEREHTLRLQAEDLYNVCSRSRKAGKALTKVALVIAGAGAAYGLLK